MKEVHLTVQTYRYCVSGLSIVTAIATATATTTTATTPAESNDKQTYSEIKHLSHNTTPPQNPHIVLTPRTPHAIPVIPMLYFLPRHPLDLRPCCFLL